ncbi:MAG: hypothetical protein ABUU24_03880 [Variovorax sp.]
MRLNATLLQSTANKTRFTCGDAAPKIRSSQPAERRRNETMNTLRQELRAFASMMPITIFVKAWRLSIAHRAPAPRRNASGTVASA